MGTNSFVQVPPDSTGKKLLALQHTVEGAPTQVPVYHLADHDAPGQMQSVDYRGAASVRFSEGSPLSDAFGNLKVSNRATLGTYDFVGNSNDSLFTDVKTGAGNIVHMPYASTISLEVSSASGDFASRTSNRYHYYYPGTSNLLMMTIALSDASHPGCERRWGAFDATDGIYYAMDETGVLQVVVRNITSGVLIKDHYARPDWNGDKLDGLGTSGFTLDVTKLNIYWLDFQWLGGGRIRFGVIDDYGNRIVCHTVLNANHNLYPYMRTGSLPIQANIQNKWLTGGAASLRWTCASVQCEGSMDYTFWRYSDIERNTPIEVTTNTPIFSMRVRAGSHVGVYPESLNMIVSGGSVKFTIVDDATLTGATWGIEGGGVAQGDLGATAATGGEIFYTFYAGPGVSHKELGDYYEINDEGYHRLADNSDSYTFTLLATKLDGTTVTVGANLNYRELR